MCSIRLALTLGSILFLLGCDTFLGADAKIPIPGKRISILVGNKTLKPDPNTSGQEILLPAPTSNENWPQTGGYANHAMHHIKVNSDIKEIWSVDIGSGTDDTEVLIAQPILSNKRLYSLDSETRVAAFSALSGAKLWSVELISEDDDEGHIGGGLASEAGRIYATTGLGEVISLNAENGQINWRRRFDAPFRTAPTVRNNRVYAMSVNNKMHVLNGTTGQTLWTHSGVEGTTNFLGGASPAVSSGVVVVAYSSGELTALKIENGKQLWTDSLSSSRKTSSIANISTIRGRPIIDRGLVFAVSNDGKLVAINLRTGQRIWNRNIGSIESPWVAGNFIFLLSESSELIALSRQTGSIYWVNNLSTQEKSTGDKYKSMWTGPVLASDRLIVAGTSGKILSISPYTGRVLGSIRMSSGVTIGPIIALDTIYFLNDDAELVAFR